MDKTVEFDAYDLLRKVSNVLGYNKVISFLVDEGLCWANRDTENDPGVGWTLETEESPTIWNIGDRKITGYLE